MELKSRALWFGFIAFTVNFSVWVLYAALGINLHSDLAISSTELGILLASPVISGAVLNVLAGFLAQRYSPRRCFVWQMIATLPALLLLPQANDLSDYIWVGIGLGTSGMAFTFGLSYIREHFSKQKTGLAMGVFGAGNAGALITLGLTPIFIELWGFKNIGYIYAALLFLSAFCFALLAPKAPRLQRFTADHQNVNLLKKLQIWRFGLYYFFVFGSFLALLLWLPSYYVKAYQLEANQAMAFCLVFVGSSSLARAFGGWLSDQYGGRTINWSVFWICLVCLFFLCYPPTTMTIHGIEHDVELHIEVGLWTFSCLIWVIAIAIGFGRASVIKLIYDYYPKQLPQAAGIVAALGALGGSILPVTFGLAEEWLGIHSASFMLLYGILALCMISMHFANKSDRQRQRLRNAVENNFLEFD
ncbi:MFS transporter [uncultured Pseudoteredinibacter sp.]|uniref:MFS transporter n=1 Tax=uncultured Pseudoteredinibacter sp. TaxID=1641701 RepID=UPI00261E934C|nr:MFS transporter [uncultured Pseudoteredinibacter sp.]